MGTPNFADNLPSRALTPQRQRQHTLEALLAWLVAEATRQPVLFIVEDLPWIDPSTLEFLTLLIERGRSCTSRVRVNTRGLPGDRHKGKKV